MSNPTLDEFRTFVLRRLLAPPDKWELSVPPETRTKLIKPNVLCFFCGNEIDLTDYFQLKKRLCKPCLEAHYE